MYYGKEKLAVVAVTPVEIYLTPIDNFPSPSSRILDECFKP